MRSAPPASGLFECDDDGECADVHKGVGEQVEERGISAVRRAGHKGDEHIAGVGDARIGEHALEARLAQRGQVAERHGDDGDDRQGPSPCRLLGGKGDEQQADQGGEPCGLGAGAHESGDRRRRALIDIRRPHMEGDKADLEAEAGDPQAQAKVEQVVALSAAEDAADGVVAGLPAP